MRDAVELEWAGIPAVAVIHENLVGSAQAIARISGMADYPFVTVGYPHLSLARWEPEEVRVVAAKVLAGIRRLLTAAGKGATSLKR